MIPDTTAHRLAHDLVAYRELLSVALALVASRDQELAARERTIVALREELGRLTAQQVQA